MKMLSIALLGLLTILLSSQTLAAELKEVAGNEQCTTTKYDGWEAQTFAVTSATPKNKKCEVCITQHEVNNEPLPDKYEVELDGKKVKADKETNPLTGKPMYCFKAKKIKAGNETIIVEYQADNMIQYDFDWGHINVTLSCPEVQNNITIFYENKFGAYLPSSITLPADCEYRADSDVLLKVLGDTIYAEQSAGFFSTEKQEVDFSDVCGQDGAECYWNDNVLYFTTYNHTIDPKVLDVITSRGIFINTTYERNIGAPTPRDDGTRLIETTDVDNFTVDSSKFTSYEYAFDGLDSTYGYGDTSDTEFYFNKTHRFNGTIYLDYINNFGTDRANIIVPDDCNINNHTAFRGNILSKIGSGDYTNFSCLNRSASWQLIYSSTDSSSGIISDINISYTHYNNSYGYYYTPVINYSTYPSWTHNITVNNEVITRTNGAFNGSHSQIRFGFDGDNINVSERNKNIDCGKYNLTFLLTFDGNIINNLCENSFNPSIIGSPDYATGRDGEEQTINLSGVSQGIRLPSNDAMNCSAQGDGSQMTWGMMFKTAGTPPQEYELFDGYNQQQFYFRMLTDNTIRFVIRINGTDATHTTTAVPQGVWHSVIFTRNFTTTKYYKNGTEGSFVGSVNPGALDHNRYIAANTYGIGIDGRFTTVDEMNGQIAWVFSSCRYFNPTEVQLFHNSIINWTEWDDGELIVGNDILYNYSLSNEDTLPTSCSPDLYNTSWSSWVNLTCMPSDQMNQTRNLTQYDLNECNANVTIFDYQLNGTCDYCTPSMTNTSLTDWYNISCLPIDKMNQTANYTTYDANYCGEVGNTTTILYNATLDCDYCTPNLVNTSQSAWVNITCLLNNTMNQSSFLVEYDDNFCGEVSNTTFWFYNATLFCNSTTADLLPPNITLIAPLDSSTQGSTVLFSSLVYDNASNLQSVALWGNWSGTWKVNQTNSTAGLNNQTYKFTQGLPEGTYIWNIRACDAVNNCGFYYENWTFSVQYPGFNVWINDSSIEWVKIEW